MHRKLLALIAVSVLYGVAVHAQLSVGGGGLYIKNGATVVLYRLQLHPTQDLNIQNNTLQVSNVPIPGSPHASIARVYKWTSAIQTKGLTGIYVQPSELNGNNFNLLQLAYSPTGNTGDYIVSTNSVTTIADHFVFETMPTTVWQQLTAIQDGSVLPLHLLSFNGQQAGSSIRLQWRTANEEQIKDYTILRSADAWQFSPIGKVAATCNGCAQITEYRYDDTKPLTGNNFYKLSITDENGKSGYTDVVKLYFNGMNTAITLSPNPTNGLFTVSGLNENSDYQISVTAADGRLMLSQSVAAKSTRHSIDASGWAAGLYYIIVNDKKGLQWRGKIMKL